MVEMIRYCPDCERDGPFERYHDVAGSCPDCTEGCCPEWSCVGCGAALLIECAGQPGEIGSVSQPWSRVA